MSLSIKEPSGFSEEKPELQFKQIISQSDIVLQIDELHLLRDYVKSLPDR